MNQSLLPPDLSAPETSRPQPPSDILTGTGYLTVFTETGGKSYPIPDTNVEIYLTDETETPLLFRVQKTDAAGKTEPVPIPAPPPADSLSPGIGFRPYTTVRVRVFHPGYYPEEAVSVPVFAGIHALQTFALLPMPESAQYLPPDGRTVRISESVSDPL